MNSVNDLDFARADKHATDADLENAAEALQGALES
jgi:hypothetical protein